MSRIFAKKMQIFCKSVVFYCIIFVLCCIMLFVKGEVSKCLKNKAFWGFINDKKWWKTARKLEPTIKGIVHFGTEGWGFESLQTHHNLACRRVFYCWQGLMGVAHQTLLRLKPPLLGLAPVSPCPSAESSHHLTACPFRRTKHELALNISTYIDVFCVIFRWLYY